MIIQEDILPTCDDMTAVTKPSIAHLRRQWRVEKGSILEIGQTWI